MVAVSIADALPDFARRMMVLSDPGGDFGE
jgi:hypothetical protein